MDVYTAIRNYAGAIERAERTAGLPPGGAMGEVWIRLTAAVSAGMQVDVPTIARLAAHAVAAETAEPTGRTHRGHTVGASMADAGWCITDPRPDPLMALVDREVEAEREDLDDDHDDRPSMAADRCARGLRAVPEARHARSARSLRRDRADDRAAWADGVLQYALPGLARVDDNAGVAA